MSLMIYWGAALTSFSDSISYITYLFSEWRVVDKKCVIFDKRMTKVTYLLKISNFDTLRFMKTCPVIRFLGIFCLGIGVFGRILSSLGLHSPHIHTYLFIRKSPRPPPRTINLLINVFVTLSNGKQKPPEKQKYLVMTI